MILFENTNNSLDFEDIGVDYELLEMEGLPVEKPEAILYFNKDRVLESIDDVIMPIEFKLEGLNKKVNVTVTYTCNSFDDTFNINKLDDDVYEVEELPDGYMVTVDDLNKLAKVLSATFTQSIVYPFDNTSKNDVVNKYLEKPNVDMSTKISKYITDLVYKVDEYKTIHQSWSNRTTRENKKNVAEIKRRAGRSDLEILFDDIKRLPGVKDITTGTLREGAKYTNRWRLFVSYTKKVKMRPVKVDEVLEILSDKAGKKFMCRVLNDSFNGAELYSPVSVLRWIKAKMNIKQTIAEEPVEDDNEDFDLTNLGLEESFHDRLKNGTGNFRTCSICGKTILGQDDCDFTENEDCVCSTCSMTCAKRRSKGNKFMEAYRKLHSFGYKITK